MKTRNIDINYINKKPLCITIGNFDGIHLGHKHLLDKLIELSNNNTMPSVVITFDPHPRTILSSSIISRILNTPSSFRSPKSIENASSIV